MVSLAQISHWSKLCHHGYCPECSHSHWWVSRNAKIEEACKNQQNSGMKIFCEIFAIFSFHMKIIFFLFSRLWTCPIINGGLETLIFPLAYGVIVVWKGETVTFIPQEDGLTIIQRKIFVQLLGQRFLHFSHKDLLVWQLEEVLIHVWVLNTDIDIAQSQPISVQCWYVFEIILTYNMSYLIFWNVRTFQIEESAIVVAGGLLSNNQPTSSVEVFIPSKNEWKSLPNMIRPRAWYPSLSLFNKSLLCVGGKVMKLFSGLKKFLWKRWFFKEYYESFMNVGTFFRNIVQNLFRHFLTAKKLFLMVMLYDCCTKIFLSWFVLCQRSFYM